MRAVPVAYVEAARCSLHADCPLDRLDCPPKKPARLDHRRSGTAPVPTLVDRRCTNAILGGAERHAREVPLAHAPDVVDDEAAVHVVQRDGVGRGEEVMLLGRRGRSGPTPSTHCAS